MFGNTTVRTVSTKDSVISACFNMSDFTGWGCGARSTWRSVIRRLLEYQGKGTEPPVQGDVSDVLCPRSLSNTHKRLSCRCLSGQSCRHGYQLRDTNYGQGSRKSRFERGDQTALEGCGERNLQLEFCYVSSKENQADDPSRRISAVDAMVSAKAWK